MVLAPSTSRMSMLETRSDTLQLVRRKINQSKTMDTLRLIKSSNLSSNVRPDLLRKNKLSAHHRKQHDVRGYAPCLSESYFDGTRWYHQHSRSRTIPIGGTIWVISTIRCPTQCIARPQRSAFRPMPLQTGLHSITA